MEAVRNICAKFSIREPWGEFITMPTTGIYLLCDDPGDNVVYVGRSNNVYSRIREHWHGNKIPFWTAHIYVVENAREIVILERELIKVLRPKYNVVHNQRTA
jgi:excinuclease UvrABC nuclease subunit